MNYTDLTGHLENVILNTEYKHFLYKSWIFKNKCSVLDFTYKNVSFAFDFILLDSGKINIFLVERNDDIIFLWKKDSISKKIKLLTLSSLFEIDLFLAIIDEIFKTIDKEYKYRVSVIIPVYNREKLILKCISSLNNQTLDNNDFEVVFIDDKSTDNTISVIRDNISPDVNYKILERPVGSGNASAPRNDGIKISKGRFLFFLDSDDYISHECLENALVFAEENNSDIVYLKMGSDDEYPRGVPVRAFKKGNVKRANITKNHLFRSFSPCKYFRRAFLLKNSILFNPALVLREDQLLCLQALSLTNKVSILADQDYIYLTRHDGEHLTQHLVNLELDAFVYLIGYSYIFASSYDLEYRNELFNGWTIKLIERLIKVCKTKRYSLASREKYFFDVLLFIDQKNYSLDEKKIYNNFHKYLDSIRQRDFNMFFDLSNDKR